MIAKTILVMYLLASRAQVQVQVPYVVRYPSEAACLAAVAKVQGPDRWQSYPAQKAECVFDATGASK